MTHRSGIGSRGLRKVLACRRRTRPRSFGNRTLFMISSSDAPLSNATQMTTFVISSDSEGHSEHGARGVPVAGVGPASLNSPLRAAEKSEHPLDEDPDWVKEFTPIRRPQRRAARARDGGNTDRALDGAGSIGVASDGDADGGSDSILDLSTGILGVDDDGAQPETQVVESIDEAHGGLAERQKALTQPVKLRSTLPLTAGPKFDQNLVLVQAESGTFDLSGDVGAVGRVKVDPNGVYLDVKGALYSCSVQAINTVCVVAVGDDEARVTAVLDEVITLRQDQSNIKSGEHLISGILDEDEIMEDAQGDPSASGTARPASHRRKSGNMKASTNTRTKPKLKSKSTARPRSRPTPKAKK